MMARTILIAVLVFVMSSAAFAVRTRQAHSRQGLPLLYAGQDRPRENGADDYHFITVESNSSDILAGLQGFPGRYWGLMAGGAFLSGDERSLTWLNERDLRFQAVTIDPDITALYLCYFDTDNLPGGPKIAAGRDYIVTAAPAPGADAVRRLRPMRVPSPGGGEPPSMILTYDPVIDALIDRVDRDTIIAFLTGLSGNAPIQVGGRTDTIRTRYTGTADNRMAAQYLKETLERYGYQTEYHGFYSGNLRHVAAFDGSRAWAVSEASEAIRTSDGGASWRVMPDGTASTLWGVENAGPDSVWITGDVGTIRFSSDGGATFMTRASSFHGFQFGVDFINNLEGWIAADSGRVIHTTNGGASWVTQITPVGPTGARFYDVCFVDNQFGWAAGRNGAIVYTTNGGAAWTTQVSTTSERLYGVDFTSRANGWIVGWGGVVLHTIDGGANWETVDLGTSTEMYHVDFADSTRGCIVGWEGEIYFTTNGGAAWTQVEAVPGADFYGFDFGAGLTGFAVGTGALAKTTDGGATWANQAAAIESASLNVIATRRGTTDAGRQVIICGHMDNTSQQPLISAPGADDNGSGTSAVIEAARIFAGIPFERTIKFCLWTGEEQGMLGSQFYAADAHSRGDTIAGVFNFDMIAWEGNGDSSIELHCGSMPASQSIGHLFEDVLTDYSIALEAEFLTWNSTDRSDHASFWDQGYPAILGIEDFSGDFNPYYHTTSDDMDIIDTSFFLGFVRAAVGATASLALPDTQFTSAFDGEPLPLGFELKPNFPNPFNPATRLSFSLPRAGHARLEIYDLLGRVVRTLVDGPMEAGYHRVDWDGQVAGGARASSGVYFARLQHDGAAATIRMTLAK